MSATSTRELSYPQAINEAFHQAMDMSPDVFVMGQLVDYPSGIFGTTSGLVEKFGTDRVQDFPVSEATMTSVAMGAAIAGMRPVIVHQRLDFMIYSLDAIVNWLSLWRFKSAGQSSVPVTIRAIVGKGWGQGPQHSKSLHSWFAHLPGLRVAMPATAYDAKGLMLESMFGEDPTIIIEGRPLYSMKNEVPERPYRVPFGKGVIRRNGKDITIVALGVMVPIALKAAELLEKQGIWAEVIDPRTIAPLDIDLICSSVKHTGRLIVADPAWATGSFSSEIITRVCERSVQDLKANPVRVTLPDSHTPMSASLEKSYYPDETTIVAKALEILKQ